jgi:hypothetical protein
MQGAMYHSGLRGFRYDLEVWRRDLPGDWDLAQRMLDAGVVFCFAEELVGTYNVRAANIAGWFKVAAERGTVPGNVI